MTASLNHTAAWINQKRLRDYPRLMFIASWLILALNIIFHTGWQGGLGQIIGGDFVVLYSSGLLYRDDPKSIYDYDQQILSQQSLISPTHLPGLNPYISPPYVAYVYSLLTFLPLTPAFILWSGLMIICVIISVYIIGKMTSAEIIAKGLSRTQLLILVLSFFPFIESLQAGQNSGLTLSLMTCLIYLTLKERNFLAGLVAGIMIYKPQYILGFLILWVVWKNFKAITGFLLVTVLWIGSFYIINGLELFRAYQSLSQVLVLLPYIEGFPAYIFVTLYGLISTIFPLSAQPYTYAFSQIVLGISLLALGIYAFALRNKSTSDRIPACILAILLPLLATPYALLHDLVILIPALVLWARYRPNRQLLITTIVVYFGAFFLTLISAFSHLALNALLVIGLVALVIILLVKPSLSSTVVAG